MNNDKIYKINIYTIKPNMKYKYKNESLKEIIKTFVDEEEYYKIGELLAKETNNKDFLEEIITKKQIPIYRIYDEDLIDIYGHITSYHKEYSTEYPTFTIVKEFKEKEDKKTIFGTIRLTTEKSNSLKEATRNEFQKYYFDNKNPIYFKKKIVQYFKQGEENFLSTKFVKLKNIKKRKKQTSK